MSTDYYSKIFALLLVILFSQNLFSQKFGGNLVLGFNASQIDGDQLAGYNKVGFCAGIGTNYELKDPWQINVDFLFSQRGSQSKLFPDEYSEIRKLTLNYIELPVYVSYKDWYIESERYYKVEGFAGLSFGRLINAKNSLGEKDINQDNFFKNDLSYLIGAKFNFNKNWGASFRYTRSFTRLYKNPVDDSTSLLSYFLNFNLIYKIL